LKSWQAMRAMIEKSRVTGRIPAPASKSYTIRALICAGMAGGASCISGALESDDTKAAVGILKNLGAGLRQEKDGLVVSGGNLAPAKVELDCGDSAASLRFFSAVCATLPGKSVLVSSPGLARRPVKSLLEIINKMGAVCLVEENRVIINGGCLHGGLYNLEGDISSQFISALLLAAPRICHGAAFVLDSPPRSRPYIDMTLETLGRFGISVNRAPDYTCFSIAPQSFQPANISIEGDWSSASYLLALGAVTGEVSVEGLNLLSLQADKAILMMLNKMGAAILPDAGSVTTRVSRLNAIDADMSQCIDLLPTMACCLAVAEGKGCLRGISRARLKESNRVEALRRGLESMGIKTEEDEDSLTIWGGSPEGAVIDSYNDHRIAMAFAVAGLCAGNTVIERAECVSKTYPRFWHDLIRLGGKVRLQDE